MLLLMVAIIVIAKCPAIAPPIAANDLDLSHYAFDVDFDPDTRSLTGDLVLNWRNTTGEAQRELYFRLYPNAPHYGDGATHVTDIAIDGREAEGTLWPDRTVLEIEIDREVDAGGHAEIALSFDTTVPTTSDASFGILGGDVDSGWRLADWHPILAGWEVVEGWYLDPPTRFGDPTFAESATYELELTAPDDYEVLGSGITVEETIGGSTDQVTTITEQLTTIIETAPGRDLTLSLLPDAPPGAIETNERDIAGFTVRVSLTRDQAIPGLAAAILEIASETLPLYESWFGEYPDRELDITAAPLAGANAVAWNGMVWLDLEAIVRDGELSDRTLDILRFVLTHELAHQWIAGIVGSNNNDHGFMSEGLANILAVLAIREIHSIDEAERALRAFVAASYLAMLESAEDGIADAPLGTDSDIGTRAQLVYGKGALGFEAIRQTIGDDAFVAGLGEYATEFRFRVSGPDDLRHAFETASGADLGALWSLWFEEERSTLADVVAILDSFSMEAGSADREDQFFAAWDQPVH